MQGHDPRVPSRPGFVDGALITPVRRKTLGCAAFRAAVPEPISERVATHRFLARALESARPYQRGQETRRAASTQEAAGVRRKGAQGLADDVRHYGRWMRDEAEKRIGHLYPPVEITPEMVRERPDLKPYHTAAS